MKLYPELSAWIHQFEKEFERISDARRLELQVLSSAIRNSMNTFGRADLLVICTHNSRRSQLGQLWLKAAALHYGINPIGTYSGGTEATAFNHRMVLAIKRAGFRVKQLDESENPKYYIPVSDDDYNLDIYYSKRFDESYNPQKNYIAVMVCTQADEACPMVSSAYQRISLPYEDPKQSDGTESESAAYDLKLMEIGRESAYVMSLLH